MTQKGIHTWDIVYQYHRCPACGFIIESREAYSYQNGKWQKPLTCTRCHHAFNAIKLGRPKQSLLGKASEPPEFEWQ